MEKQYFKVYHRTKWVYCKWSVFHSYVSLLEAKPPQILGYFASNN